MRTLWGWIELARMIIWMAIADTWIAKRQRRPPAAMSQPTGDDLALERGIRIARIVVVTILSGAFLCGVLIGWIARSHWG